MHEQLQLLELLLAAAALLDGAGGLEVAADDFLLGGLAAHRVVDDGIAHHVHAHVRGALVRAFTVDALEDGLEHREGLDIAVVVDRSPAVGFQVEGVDHVHVVQISRGGLVGQVHRVLERQVPDREGLELRVARLHAPLVLMVELGKAGGHLAAARARRGDHHQRAGGLDVIVAAVPLVADDVGHVGGIIRDAVELEHLKAHGVQPVHEHVRRRLAGVLGERDAAHVQAEVPEHVHQADDIGVIGDAQIAAQLVLLDVVGIDGDHDFRLIPELQQHLDLVVRRKAGQHAGGMVIVKQLAAELQIQLAAKGLDALANARRLQLNVLLTVETDLFHVAASFVRLKRGESTLDPQKTTGVLSQKNRPCVIKAPLNL